MDGNIHQHLFLFMWHLFLFLNYFTSVFMNLNDLTFVFSSISHHIDKLHFGDSSMPLASFSCNLTLSLAQANLVKIISSRLKSMTNFQNLSRLQIQIVNQKTIILSQMWIIFFRSFIRKFHSNWWNISVGYSCSLNQNSWYESVTNLLI